MVEFFYVRKDGKTVPFMYMLPDGINVEKEDGVLNFEHLKPYVGDLIKVVYLESDDPKIYEHGNAEVEVGIITLVTNDNIIWE
jgi:hypothetical protein